MIKISSAILAILSVDACTPGEKTADAQPVDVTSVDIMPDRSVSGCALGATGVCAPKSREVCCSLSAKSVNFERNCLVRLAGTDSTLFCQTLPTMSICPPRSLVLQCYRRATPDGGEEVFLSPYVWPDESVAEAGLTLCSNSTTTRVASFVDCP
jgi:hypothetical protein